MNIRGFIEQARRVLKLATKPKRKEVFQTTKVVLLGAVLIGLFAFVVHLIFIVIGFHP